MCANAGQKRLPESKLWLPRGSLLIHVGVPHIKLDARVAEKAEYRNGNWISSVQFFVDFEAPVCESLQVSANSSAFLGNLGGHKKKLTAENTEKGRRVRREILTRSQIDN